MTTEQDRTVQIRRATVTDSSEITTVLAQSARAAFQGIVDQAYLDELDSPIRHTRWTETLAATAWPRTGTLVAVEDDGIVGLLNFAAGSDLDLDPNVAVEVTTMYVLPEHWRLGVGRALMATAIHDFGVAGYRHATLWVMAANLRARAFYEANRWRADARTRSDDTWGLSLRYSRDLAEP
jgi:GNAT superfamily N-acetyltransferase